MAATDAVTNLQYLKNALVAYMCASGVEERRRMLPAISLLLHLRGDELKRIHAHLDAEGGGLLSSAWGLFGKG